MTTETSTSIDPSAFFGHLTFNTDEMAKRLPPPVAKSLARTIAKGEKLDPSIVDAVALAMKEWALEHGIDPLLPLVHPADRLHRREARRLPAPLRRWHGWNPLCRRQLGLR